MNCVVEDQVNDHRMGVQSVSIIILKRMELTVARNSNNGPQGWLGGRGSQIFLTTNHRSQAL